MSILDTFYILFKTDADKAADDIDKVDDASNRAEKGLTKVDAAASKLGNSFINMAKAVAAPLIALASVGTLMNIAMDRASSVRELDQVASKLNSGIADVDAFSRSIKGAGGETAAAVDSLTKLGEKLNEAFSDKDSGARKDFKEWGVAFKDVKGQALGAVEGMLVLAKSLESVSRAEALARIKKLGIEDAATIDLLLKGRTAVEEKMNAEKRAGVVTENQARIAREYQAEIGQTQNLLTSFANSIMEMVLPTVTRLAAGFREFLNWLVNNRVLVEGFFIGVAAVVTAVFLPALVSAAAAVLAATWPFLALGATIAAVGAAFALAYEDVVGFMNGQPSLIGALVEKYEWFATIVEGIGFVFRTMKDAVTRDIELIKSAWSAVVDAFRAAPTVIGPIMDMIAGKATDFGEAYSDALETLQPLWSALGEAADLAGDIWDRVSAKLSDDAGKLSTVFSQRFAEIGEKVKSVFNAMFGDIAPTVDQIRDAANLIKQAFVMAFDAIKSAWNSTIGLISSGISSAVSSLRQLLDLPVGGGRVPANDNQANLGQTVGEMATQARNALNTASGSPLNGQTSQTLPGAVSTVNTSNVSVGNVNVNTQATDAKGVAAAVKGALQRELRGTAAQFDDGVDR